jgi:hypothetical protein
MNAAQYASILKSSKARDERYASRVELTHENYFNKKLEKTRYEIYAQVCDRAIYLLENDPQRIQAEAAIKADPARLEAIAKEELSAYSALQYHEAKYSQEMWQTISETLEWIKA